MLNVGEKAPPIDAVTSRGDRFVLAEQQALCTVVYFFPKAFTPGCTVETRLFRDNHNELALAGAALVGISTDDLETQCSFAASVAAPFPLIGDKDQRISSAYGVLWPMLGIARRVTYVVGPKLEVAAVFKHELFVKEHRNDVLRFVNELFKKTRATD